MSQKNIRKENKNCKEKYERRKVEHGKKNKKNNNMNDQPLCLPQKKFLKDASKEI